MQANNAALLPLIVGINVISDLLDSDSSSGESDNEMEELAVIVMARSCLTASFPERHPRLPGYLNHILEYSDRDFWRHFRVSQDTFSFILNGNNFRPGVVYHGGCEPMENNEVLLICLQYLANQGAMRLYADKFNRTESYILNAVRWVTKFLF